MAQSYPAHFQLLTNAFKKQFKVQAISPYSSMATETPSGTPMSSSPSPTLVATPTADFKPLLFPTGSNILRRSASDLIELVASCASISSAVYVYDVAEQVGFGTLTRTWASSLEQSAPAIPLQTRAGAGLGLVGRLSEGTSQDGVNGSILTAYTTPAGLAAMAGSLTYLPPASSRSRLIVQVPAATPVGDTFALSSTLASLSVAFNLLPDNVAVLLSATPQESVDLATLAYKLNSSHVVHIFDHHSASREVGHNFTSNILVKDVSGLAVPEALRLAGYEPFEFAGDRNAHTVFVLLNGQLAVIARALASRTEGIAVVIKHIPSSAEEVYVFDDVPHESSQGPLFVDVFAALYNPSAPGPKVRAQRITPDKTQEFNAYPAQFAAHLASLADRPSADVGLESTSSTKLLFLSTPSDNLSFFYQLVTDTFSNAISTCRLTNHDVYSRTGGVTADRIILASKKGDDGLVPISAAFPLHSNDSTDFVCILEPNLLKSHSVLEHAKPGSVVLVTTSWSSAELLEHVPAEVLELISQKQLRLYTIDAKVMAVKLASDSTSRDTAESLILYLAFVRLYLGKSSNEGVVRKIAQGVAHGACDDTFAKISAHTWAGLFQIELPSELPPAAVADGNGNAEAVPALKRFEFNAIAVDTGLGGTVYNGSNGVLLARRRQAPLVSLQIPDRTYLVTCTVNRRLTPLDYDRNVFHLEFSTEGTGLKYAIGEALGVHGWNDDQEVLDFCVWYGVDPNRLVTIPVGQGGDKMHTRTIFQALQQQIDLFGEPPKSFYTSLAPYATNPAEKLALQFIGSPEGSSTFKKLNEKDTVNFAELLQRYPSAKPGIETLCEMIGDIKPRHYSIASAQSVVGNQVDLLIVTVDWLTPSGMRRYGQCTRYLNGLKIGQKVTVSVKPSVMKLPPDDTQPIIMAGLGTGAAPFRAFLQHRAFLSQQGIEVGPTYYYFGSRHQHQEYLYGEEIEAYILDNTITKAGLAFSRDGPKKVYIQHKMLEDAETLADMLKNREGVFYLCGPTWPVPDVYEALVGALVKSQGMAKMSAGEFLEGLKEEERYVLEVY
ncbi:hypothetical protein BU15DRAFT_69990 [Melanogaster broomeanus]|nr:hypothetical protein BU15DRAFT_69990 [Melanogaster broomeanus]